MRLFVVLVGPTRHCKTPTVWRFSTFLHPPPLHATDTFLATLGT